MFPDHGIIKKCISNKVSCNSVKCNGCIRFLYNHFWRMVKVCQSHKFLITDIAILTWISITVVQVTSNTDAF